MPQLDSCHPQVVNALEKAGGTVAPEPVRLDTPINILFADIFARRPVELGDQEIIVVEAKCFQKAAREWRNSIAPSANISFIGNFYRRKG